MPSGPKTSNGEAERPDKKPVKQKKELRKPSDSKQQSRERSPAKFNIVRSEIVKSENVISFKIEFETVLVPKYSEIGAVLCPGNDVRKYLKQYGFDESRYPKPGDIPGDNTTRWRKTNERAIRGIVEDLLKANGISSHTYGVIARENENLENKKLKLNCVIRNVIGEATIKEAELTHYGMGLILGIFNSQIIDETQQYCRKVFSTILKCFDIISNETCGTRIDVWLSCQPFTTKQISGCAKWMTIYEKASYGHLSRSRQLDVTREVTPNTKKDSLETKKLREREDSMEGIFHRIDRLNHDSKRVVDLVNSFNVMAYEFSPAIKHNDKHYKATFNFQRLPQALTANDCLHWAVEKVASLHDMATRDFTNTAYTRKATPEEYGTMIRGAAREVGVEKWLKHFGVGRERSSVPGKASTESRSERTNKRAEDKVRDHARSRR